MSVSRCVMVIWLWAFALAGIAGCLPNNNNDQYIQNEFLAEIEGTEYQSGISGLGYVLSRNSEFIASIEIIGATEELNDLMWGIFEGRCDSAGAVMGPNRAYPALSVNHQGHAGAKVTISGTGLDPERKYNVAVYQPEERGADSLVACGNLSHENFTGKRGK